MLHYFYSLSFTFQFLITTLNLILFGTCDVKNVLKKVKNNISDVKNNDYYTHKILQVFKKEHVQMNSLSNI